MAGELHFYPFVIGQTGVIPAQDLENFRPREFRWHRAAFREPLAQFSARHQQPVLVTVRAGAPGRHAGARVAPERPVDLHWLDLEGAIGNFVEHTVRVGNAATRDQASRSNAARVSAGVMNRVPYFALKPPSDSTCTGPARFTSPCCMTIFTPGCSTSMVLNTDKHSCATSMRYFSVTFITARRLSSSGSVSARSSPTRMRAPVAPSADSVIGICQ